MSSREVQELIERLAPSRDNDSLIEDVFQALVKYREELLRQERSWQAERDAPLG